MHGCSYVTLFCLKSANNSCKDIIRANTKAHCKSKYYAHIFSFFVIKLWKVREPRGLHSIFPLSLLWGGTSLAATVLQHTTTLDSAEKYIVNTSLRLREFWKLLLVKMSLLFSYWCVGLYQWGGRTDKDNDKVKINGKLFVSWQWVLMFTLVS